MADPLIEQLRPLGLEKYAGRLTRIVSDAMQVVLDQGPLQKGMMQDEAGEMLVNDLDAASARLSGEGGFVLDIVRKLGEPGLEAVLARANVADQAALQVFRDRAKRDGGILPMLEVDLGGFDDKLVVARSGLKAQFEKLKVSPKLPEGTTLATGVVLPTGPMMIMSNSMGCTGAKLAIGGGAGLMVAGMIMEDGGMFTMGAAALGIGIGAASYFC
jgi:hypothetical protein